MNFSRVFDINQWNRRRFGLTYARVYRCRLPVLNRPTENMIQHLEDQALLKIGVVLNMQWTPEAEDAIKKVPFFVRKKVRARVEKEARLAAR